MRKVTLGGDRLGSGKKQKVELHGYERSTHDMGYLWRSSMSAGTLVPFLHEVGLPGDTFDINLGCDIKTHPTVGPLFGSYKVQLDIFTADMRLYQGQLHNNKLKVGLNMSAVKLPIIDLQATVIDPETTKDIDNSQINPSCIWSYLGIRGVGMCDTPQTRQFNALKILAYWDIYKNYYANKQEEIGAVIHTQVETVPEIVTSITDDAGTDTIAKAPATSAVVTLTGENLKLTYTGGIPPNLGTIILRIGTGDLVPLNLIGTIISDTGTVLTIQLNLEDYGDHVTFVNWDYSTNVNPAELPIDIVIFDLNNLDTIREMIMEHTPNASAFNVTDADLAPFNLIMAGQQPSILRSQEGLGLKTYQSDLFNNWLRTEYIDGPGGINEITAVSTVGDSFQIDALTLAKKVYNMLNRIAVSGGTYQDWIIATYDHEPYMVAETPVYHGGLIKELVFQEVVSNSATDAEGGQPLGTLAGKGIMAQKHKGGQVSIKVNEHCIVMGIISITPRIDYSQGNKWDNHLLTMDDFHKPPLDEIGFQELITEQMAWWSTKFVGAQWQQKSAGKQPAWINYMTNVNENRGNFAIAENEMFMTLNRRYEYNTLTTDAEILDLTTYIDPTKFNYIFAQTALDAQNFWAQIAVDMTVRRKMSAKVMPNL